VGKNLFYIIYRRYISHVEPKHLSFARVGDFSFELYYLLKPINR